MCENTDSRCTTTRSRPRCPLSISGLSRFLLPTFLCGMQRKVGAAPHRGNANRPLTNQGKANAIRTRTTSAAQAIKIKQSPTPQAHTRTSPAQPNPSPVTCNSDIDMSDQYLTTACSAATLNPSNRATHPIKKATAPPGKKTTLGDTTVSIEFIGMIQTRKVSETHAPQGPVIDIDYVEQFARAHEAAGFDRILVPHHSTSPDALLTVAHAASVTSKVHFMLAHRPGFVSPTLAARQLATLDHYSGGRLAVHIISGGDDAEQRRDGDYLSHDERYARTDEYLHILRRIWTEAKPFDHSGQYYRFEQGFSEVKPVQHPHIPVYFGGASAPALEIAGRHADVYALWGESKAQVREQVARVRAAAAKHGRNVRFSVSFRPILAAT